MGQQSNTDPPIHVAAVVANCGDSDSQVDGGNMWNGVGVVIAPTSTTRFMIHIWLCLWSLERKENKMKIQKVGPPNIAGHYVHRRYSQQLIGLAASLAFQEGTAEQRAKILALNGYPGAIATTQLVEAGRRYRVALLYNIRNGLACPAWFKAEQEGGR